MEFENLVQVVGAIFFTSDRPVSKERVELALANGSTDPLPWPEIIESLEKRFEAVGVELRLAPSGYQLVSKASYAAEIRRFLEAKPFRLGRATLETLAIIAYRQPITRAEIDSVRGMESSHLIRTLIERGLVKMSGKADAPGRPVQYGTTERFMEVVGIPALQQLPPLSELEELQGHAEDKLEEGLGQFMADASSTQEKLFDAEEGLTETIDALLLEAGTPEEEVYPSRAHAEVASENKESVKAFQAWSRSWRKKRTQAAAAVADPTEVPPAESGSEPSALPN